MGFENLSLTSETVFLTTVLFPKNRNAKGSVSLLRELLFGPNAAALKQGDSVASVDTFGCYNQGQGMLFLDRGQA